MARIKISPVYQNLIVGTLAVSIVSLLLRIYVLKSEGRGFWILFFLIGPLIGYLSGRERQRVQSLSREKNSLSGSMDKIQAQLKQSTQKYHLMIENLSDAVFLTTEDGRFVLFNRALALLSGLTPSELKQMRLSQLRFGGGKDGGKTNEWVDNGIHRYEDCWKSPAGKQIPVDISAKWLKLGGKQLILYSARDLIRRKKAESERRKREIAAALKQKLQENARSQYALYQHILSPQTRTVGLLKSVAEKFSPARERVSAVLGEWSEASKFVGNLMEKNVRDLETSRRPWNLNAVIEQELDYLQKLTPLKDFERKTWFSPDLPGVPAFGYELSISFGLVIRAALLSVEAPRKREISVTTHLRDGQILAEIKAPPAVHFHDYLMSVLDPGYAPGAADRRQLSEAVCQELFRPFGGVVRIETGETQGAVIRVQIKNQATGVLRPEMHEPEPPPEPAKEDDPLVI
ncbi:MAG TPA: PAS domain S-box protein [bacterium]|nr:PAS domain S-box protein [bacterium]